MNQILCEMIWCFTCHFISIEKKIMCMYKYSNVYNLLHKYIVYVHQAEWTDHCYFLNCVTDGI